MTENKNILNIKLIPQKGEYDCARSCYLMVASYLFPDTPQSEIEEVIGYKEEYVTFAFRFWEYCLERGVEIVDYDELDAELWAREGVPALKKVFPGDSYDFIISNSQDINEDTEDLRKVFDHSSFKFFQKDPKLEDLLGALDGKNVCEVVLNKYALDGEEGYSLHRVVILGVEDEQVVLLDPWPGDGLTRVSFDHFSRAWGVDGAELCVYTPSW